MQAREATMAKLMATASAQEAIESVIQRWEGAGVQTGSELKHLYREISALRIYEGVTEVQLLTY
ncbi:acyl-CoA dehydrogenase family protein [Advenella sp. S44]|uniref:acyl-CoA dehydrogenase family protein n=1 Tax=Advenella sp. S44 TaxID=1982755 RepID=UPI002100A973|nr:acyl-CoA dehydrogenase family protein [Advenella sp. S44]